MQHQSPLDVMDHAEHTRDALSDLSIGDLSGGGGGGGGVSMIFTDDPDEDSTPNTSVIARPSAAVTATDPPEGDVMEHSTTASSTWRTGTPKPNTSLGPPSPIGSPNHPDSSDNDEILL